jgi:predicted membrane protein
MVTYPPSVPQYYVPSGTFMSPAQEQLQVQYATAAAQTLEAQRTLLKWGTVGVLFGATANALVTALAFRSYGKSKSVWKPALWSGAGSLIIGGTFLWVMSQSLSQPLGSRAQAVTVGAKLAV